MRRNRRVKIVATLGPASNNEETMRRLFEAGADVFRVNMSHATHDGLRDIHAIVRKLEVEFSRPIGILVDLQGPKLRIGKFESGSIRLTMPRSRPTPSCRARSTALRVSLRSSERDSTWLTWKSVSSSVFSSSCCSSSQPSLCGIVMGVLP